ncbi:MAG: hypothetical protein ABIN91_07275 [Mucilaginibacter sp.]|uniref:hypothetical protein n=1 Tax=Mucilaginibacter sp. TaxID=1882438 RepID=UPI00326616C6
MWTNRRLILIFYKPLFILNIALSLFSVYFISTNGWHANMGFNNVVVTSLLKLAGYAVSAGYQYTMLQNVYFYYRNAGVSVLKLYLQVLVIDFGIYTLLLLFYNLLS